MSYDYETQKENFYNSIQGTPQSGIDIYFDGKDHTWTSLSNISNYQSLYIFVGNPINCDWSYQVVYCSLSYDVSKYFSDRGF